MVFSGVAQVAGQSSAFGGEMVGSAIAHKRARQLMNEQQNWQERMSNTAYQRGVADLDKAGLNRILALGKGGMGPASTPSGGIVASGSKPELGRGINRPGRKQMENREATRQSKYSHGQRGRRL